LDSGIHPEEEKSLEIYKSIEYIRIMSTRQRNENVNIKRIEVQLFLLQKKCIFSN